MSPAESLPAMVIHGGSGVISAYMTPEIEVEVRDALKQAVERGYAELKSGKPALDAVSAAIQTLEDDPNFNAGRGSVFNHDGVNEMDASIMDGATLRAGAIAGVHAIRNPITLARAVMEKSDHVMLTGAGAEAFAKTVGVVSAEPAHFRTDRRWNELQKAKQEDEAGVTDAKFVSVKHFGTVGAVALDQQGHIAAGTSTGGMTDKRYGRVGDSPLIGAGTYANADCGVSSTGWGEFYIRTVAAHSICTRVALLKEPLQKAADTVINADITKLGGNGGAIALDAKGTIAMPFNTDGMFRAWIGTDGVTHVAIFADEKN
ncbi:MAG: isoaspartyl peptidase/L-asparaginase [Dokdonella sp.]